MKIGYASQYSITITPCQEDSLSFVTGGGRVLARLPHSIQPLSMNEVQELLGGDCCSKCSQPRPQLDEDRDIEE